MSKSTKGTGNEGREGNRSEDVEAICRKRAEDLNSNVGNRPQLTARYGVVRDAQEFASGFEVIGFAAPYMPSAEGVMERWAASSSNTIPGFTSIVSRIHGALTEHLLEQSHPDPPTPIPLAASDQITAQRSCTHMSALDGVLADLVESDRECAYVTVKREPLESLIAEWLGRGDQIAVLCGLLARMQKELVASWEQATREIPQSLRLSRDAFLRELHSAAVSAASVIAHHRHAVRQELAAKLKQVLRSTIAEVHTHVTDALLTGDRELAERLESERQTVETVISAIDALVTRLMTEELAKVSEEGSKNVAPPA
jgi:hypothetical protein